MKFLKNYWSVMLSILIVLIISIMFCVVKQGFFLDEIYSFGLANSSNGPFLKSLFNNNFNDVIVTQSDLVNYLTVNDETGLNINGIIYNQQCDVHPPLFYFFINVFSFIFKGALNKWAGLTLNILLFVGTLILIYLLIWKTTHDKFTGILAILFYGLSTIGLNTVIYIRMYMMLTFLSCLLSYEIVLYLINRKKIMFPIIGSTILLGLLTQYCFLFFAFFSCLILFIVMTYNVKRKTEKLSYLLLFLLFSIASVLIFVLIWPVVFEHLGNSGRIVSNYSFLNKLFSLKIVSTLYGITKQCIREFLVQVALAILAILIVIINRKKIKIYLSHYINVFSMLIIIPAILSYLVVASTAPYNHARYVYNLMPYFAILASLIVSIAYKSINKNKKSYAIGFFLFVIVISFMNVSFKMKPQTYNDERIQNEEMLLQFTDKNTPIVYLDDNSVPAPTSDIPKLLHFDEFAVTSNIGSKFLNDYLSKYNSEEVIVFIDRYKTYKEDEDLNKVVNTMKEDYGYKFDNKLFKHGLSECIVLSKN